ncbi:MAG: hypothetical protein HYX80_09845 [Chloroflexi bacterium]|nr:hypothetical protein [Chloroflexota bacterium]
MSLTSFVESPEVKARLRDGYPTPKIQCTKSIQVEPSTTSYSLTGTAFDYLMRFWIETLNPNAKTEGWVAEDAVELLESGQLPAPASIKRTARKMLDSAMVCHSDYLKTCKLNDDIISAAIQLAQLDPIYRALAIDPNMGKVDKAIIDEMRRMLQLAKPEEFTAKSYCALNPTFGEASVLVGGADADLIIDDTMIDIKTIKSGKMDTGQFHQLIGYFILNHLGGVNGKNIKINCLGIYFSRYGELVTFSTKNIVTDKFPQLVKWFKDTAESQAHP